MGNYLMLVDLVNPNFIIMNVEMWITQFYVLISAFFLFNILE